MGSERPEVGKNIVSNVYTTCATYDGVVPEGATVSLVCNPLPIHGRYVVVHKPQTTSALTLCEVQVFAAVNISRGDYCYAHS